MFYPNFIQNLLWNYVAAPFRHVWLFLQRYQLRINPNKDLLYNIHINTQRNLSGDIVVNVSFAVNSGGNISVLPYAPRAPDITTRGAAAAPSLPRDIINFTNSTDDILQFELDLENDDGGGGGEKESFYLDNNRNCDYDNDDDYEEKKSFYLDDDYDNYDDYDNEEKKDNLDSIPSLTPLKNPLDEEDDFFPIEKPSAIDVLYSYKKYN